MRTLVYLGSLGLTSTLLIAPHLHAQTRREATEDSSFGVYRVKTTAALKSEVEAWLQENSKAAFLENPAYKVIWEVPNETHLDKLAKIFSLVDPQARKIIQEGKNAHTVPPEETPALLLDPKQAKFFRANLALIYARSIYLHHVYEEALQVLRRVSPSHVADPASYFFIKAVCAHNLMLKEEANRAIDHLLTDVPDAPFRYQNLAALMYHDMLTWEEKDMAWLARKMKIVERRLELTRGGKQTQKIQREILLRLDEMIKEAENKQKSQDQNGGGEDENGGSCPPGTPQPGKDQPGQGNAPIPQNDTQGGNENGTGSVDAKKVKEIAEVWGKLPPKEQAKAMRELTKNMPPKDRAVIERYLQELQKRSGSK